MVYNVNIKDMVFGGTEKEILESVIDPTHGYCFYDEKPLDAYELKQNPLYLEKFGEEYACLYKAIAINEYNPLDERNDYTKSKLNAYYNKILTIDHNGNWIMGEDK